MRRPSRSIAMACGAFVLFALTATGCGDGDETPGRIDLDLSGGTPRDSVREAWLEISGLTVERADGTRVQHGFDAPQRIDLATLGRGNATTLLEDMELPAGRYEWIHLHLNTKGKKDTYLVLADDSVRELVVPSEERDHLRIETPFEVPPDGEVKRTIDFHLHEPLGEKGPTSNTYALRPILRSVETETASHIRATVRRDIIERHCREPHRSGLALYVFAGRHSRRYRRQRCRPGQHQRRPRGKRRSSIRVPCGVSGSWPLPPSPAGGDKPASDDSLAYFATADVHTGPGDTVDHHFAEPELR